SGRRRHTRFSRDWSSDVCSSDLAAASAAALTPSTTSAATSGTTVICSALSQRRPMGCTRSATSAPRAGSLYASDRPTTAPRARASRTRAALETLFFITASSLDRRRVFHQHAQVGLVFAQQQEHQVEQVLQRGLVQQ